MNTESTATHRPASCPAWCTSRHRPEYGGDIAHFRYLGRDHRSVTLLKIGERPPRIELTAPEEDGDLSALSLGQASALALLVDELGADHLAGLLHTAVRLAGGGQ